ncbi:MAG: HIT family protein [Thermoguttaceae bacterium]
MRVSYQQLWAPWRLAYIQQAVADAGDLPAPEGLLSGADPDCFLCQGAADPTSRQRYVVHRTDHALTVLNRYPYNNGHLLVAPVLHRPNLEELTLQEQVALVEEITRMVGLLHRVLHPHGFNIGLNLGLAAGAGLPNHLHWHIVPRWNGDTNFMPVLASVKVIPQALDALWQALTDELAKSPAGGPAGH